jgi:benzoyl-CoA reductase/2-hydroxyglutaryl-CoA dehydratase subunit BcrC/BadD/HgdB
MLKKYYKDMKSGLEASYKQKPRAGTRITMELASSFIDAFREDVKVVWTSYYSFPMELLAAFGVAPFDFEIATNILPTFDPGRSVNIMNRAEEEGYSTDLCSFHRLAVGCYLLGYLPRADLLLTTSYYCDGKSKTNQALAQYYGKESINLDVPNKKNRESIDYVSSQLKSIVHKLEELTGQKLDEDRLRECIKISNRARRAYSQLAELQKVKPFPYININIINLCIFGNLLAGKEVQEQIYLDMVKESREKIESGKLTPEQYRVLWLAWYPTQPTNINEIFRKNSVSIVMGELARNFWGELDEQHSFESLALWCLKNPFVGPIGQRLSGIMQIVDEYNLDGIIHFSTDACRHSCAAQRLIGDAMGKRGVPFMVLEGDMSDKRKYSAERTQFLLENFIEVMAARK